MDARAIADEQRAASVLDRIIAGRPVLLDALKPIAAAPSPIDLLRDVPAPAFGDDTAPAPIMRLADAFSRATGFDRSGTVVAATVAAAAMIDDRLRLAVRPSSGWFESARLWAAIIGPPSAGKSPTLRAATDPIKHLHVDLVRAWREVTPDPAAQGADPQPAIFTSDATVEKLSDLLAGNPRGLLMLTEELASWLGGIDAYRDGAGAKSRGEWLQLYDGGPHQVDRVKRGSILVPNWSASVLAAATPAGLRAQMKALPDDGLIHRFIPCVMQRAGDDTGSGCAAALHEWSERLSELHATTTRSAPTAELRFSAASQIEFDAQRREIREAGEAIEDVSPALASHIGKHPGMLARVALTFHLIDGRQGLEIEPDTLGRAIAFMAAVRRHAVALYLGILSQSPALELARALGRSILANRLKTAGRNDFLQHCRAWRGAPDWQQRQAVQMLEDARWLLPDESSRAYGAWAVSRWFVSDEVHARFGHLGDAHREQRRRVRLAIMGGDDA